jgi:hypothetical protein
VCGETQEQPYVGTTVGELGYSVVVANAAEWAPLFAASNVWNRVGNTFTYTGPDVLNVGTRMIETFQRMWNGANPWDEIPITGIFDSQTQIRAEQAVVTGLVFGGFCINNVVADHWDQNSLLLIILVPMATFSFLLFVYLFLILPMFEAFTPIDGGGSQSGKPAPLELPEGDLHNSVENTTDLSSYARTTSIDEELTTEQSSGIWQTDDDDF